MPVELVLEVLTVHLQELAGDVGIVGLQQLADIREGPVEPPAPEAPRRSRTLHRFRTYFLTGLVIAAPLFLTVYLTWAFVVWIDSWVTPVIPERYNPNTYLPFEIPGFGLIVAILFPTLLGFLTANFVGRKLVSWGE